MLLALWGREILKHLQRPILVQILIKNIQTGSYSSSLAVMKKKVFQRIDQVRFNLKFEIPQP
jgi:hypothetical protein